MGDAQAGRLLLENRFDFVASSYALHHLTDDQKWLALAECRRVLKPGGRVIIADLMFTDGQARESHFRELEKAGEHRTIEQLQNECTADRSRLLAELCSLGFTAKARQLTGYVHLIFARLK